MEVAREYLGITIYGEPDHIFGPYPNPYRVKKHFQKRGVRVHVIDYQGNRIEVLLERYGEPELWVWDWYGECFCWAHLL